MMRNVLGCSWIAWMTVAMSACHRDAVGDGSGAGSEGDSTASLDEEASHDDHGGSASTEAADGEAETSGGEADGGETDVTDDPWQLCDAAALADPPADAGPCSGSVPAGELDAMQAEYIFGRTTHEVDHIADLVRGDAGENGLFEVDGDDIQALTDSGYVVGHVAREEGTDRACVRLSFACWTGGHGGWGPSALDGRADVLVEDDLVEARGALGLTEGDALTGAPSAEVWVHIENASVEGSVGAFEF
jgi:hypothetical protein